MAERQLGVFTAAQARAAGFSGGAVKHHVRTGAWERVDYGAYVVAGTPATWSRRVMAACLVGPAVASHRSAAALWGLAGFGRSVVEVTALRHRRRHAPDIVWHESVCLFETDVTELEGIPVTNPVRTLIDLGTVCDDGTLLQGLDDALRRRLTSIEAVRRGLDTLGQRRRGHARVRRLLDRRTTLASVPQSVLETRFDLLCATAGLPPPVAQHEIRDDTGDFVARVDFAYPPEQVAIEIDSVRHHAGPDDWRADIARQNRIAALDWVVLRFTARDLELNPRELAAVVRRTLATRSVPKA